MDVSKFLEMKLDSLKKFIVNTIKLSIAVVLIQTNCYQCNRLIISRDGNKFRQNSRNIFNDKQSLHAQIGNQFNTNNNKRQANYEFPNNGFNSDTANFVEFRGYKADLHFVSPSSGYNLSLVRIINPLINTNKNDEFRRYVPSDPILFIHGIFESGKSFLMNSMLVKPMDYTSVNVKSIKDLNNLRQLLRNEPSANCLPFLLSNFGFDVWLLSRRAALESQRLSDKQPDKSFNLIHAIQESIRKQVQNTYNQFNPLAQMTNNQWFGTSDYLDKLRAQFNANNNSDNTNIEADLDDQLRKFVYSNQATSAGSSSSDKISQNYWHFSLDEQANLDIPKVIDYILTTSQRDRLSLIGHSLGAALPLMTLVKRPEYSHKINRQILFAPALHLGDSFRNNPLVQLLASLEPMLISYLGPISPTFFAPLIQTLVSGPCRLGLLAHDNMICQSVLDALFGFSSKQLNKVRF